MNENSMPIDDIAPPPPKPGPEGDTFKFNAIGDTVEGKVVHFGKFISDNTYNPGQRDEILVISLEQADGSVLKVWPVTKTDLDNAEAGYPDRKARAIVAAIRAVDRTELEVGATLAVKYAEDIPTKFGNAAKGFQAQYKPPTEVTVTDDDGAVTGLIS